MEEKENRGGYAKASNQEEHEDNIELCPVVLKLPRRSSIVARDVSECGLQ